MAGKEIIEVSNRIDATSIVNAGLSPDTDEEIVVVSLSKGLPQTLIKLHK